MSKIKEIVILSGKGGTGKTSIAGSFAFIAENKVIADCDVDAADLHLILQPELREKHEFWSGQEAIIDSQSCNKCGICQEICRFGAIKNYVVDSLSCEGCRFCAHVCPANAIQMRDQMAGQWFVSDTPYGTLVHARLGIAKENSGKLVALVRHEAKKHAATNVADMIICDGPPGIGCPVISSLAGANLAVIITEPTMTAIHDLERIINVCCHFSVPLALCINKYDINTHNSIQIEKYCSDNNIPIIGKIAFDHTFTDALIQHRPVVSLANTNTTQRIIDMWEQIQSLL